MLLIAGRTLVAGQTSSAPPSVSTCSSKEHCTAPCKPHPTQRLLDASRHLCMSSHFMSCHPVDKPNSAAFALSNSTRETLPALLVHAFSYTQGRESMSLEHSHSGLTRDKD